MFHPSDRRTAVLVFGSINVDLVTNAPAIPRSGETVLADAYRIGFGGKGANQAVAANRARSGPAGPVLMVGAVGRDAFGIAARDSLAHAGVDVSAVARVDQPTGCAFITVDPAGANAITVAAGANRAACADQVPDSLLDQVAVLVLQMEVPAAQSLALARRAQARGAAVLCNLAPTPACGDAVIVRGLLAACTLLVVNEHEAVATAGMLGLHAPTAEAAAEVLADDLALSVIVTLGERGALAFPGDGGPSISAAAPPIEPVDTTGAGDTFVGILAAGLASGTPLMPAMRQACIGAAMACLHPGARPGAPYAPPLP